MLVTRTITKKISKKKHGKSHLDLVGPSEPNGSRIRLNLLLSFVGRVLKFSETQVVDIVLKDQLRFVKYVRQKVGLYYCSFERKWRLHRISIKGQLSNATSNSKKSKTAVLQSRTNDLVYVCH